MRICLVEDELSIAMPLKRSLERAGFAVDTAEDGSAGLQLMNANNYDCVLLDLNLPEIGGIEFIDVLRGTGNNTPVIMLTARSQVYDKLDGFSHGADDYITKPFHIEEVIARVRAVIKRGATSTIATLEIGDYAFYPNKNILQHKDGADKTIELTTKETAILEYLLMHNDRIVSAEELLEHVWDSEVDMFTETVKTHIKTLRKKCDPDKTYITTVRGKGYIIK